MFNGTLIDDLFAVVRKAEKSVRPALLEETQPQEISSRETSNERLADFADRREANLQTE